MDDLGRNVDALGVYLGALLDMGVAAVASAGNLGNRPDLAEYARLEAYTPRRNGGTNFPLVVVGNSDDAGNRYETSNYVDTANAGILTVYAPGVNISCAVKTGTNAWGREPPGASQSTPLTAGLMGYYLSDPALQAQFVAGGAGNMPMRLKQYLIDVSRANKGTGGWGDAHTDNVPRLSNGENAECTDAIGAMPPVPAFVAPPETSTNMQFAFTEISQGLNMVLPQVLRVSLTFPFLTWDDCLLTWTSSPAVTTACRYRVIHSNRLGCLCATRRVNHDCHFAVLRHYFLRTRVNTNWLSSNSIWPSLPVSQRCRGPKSMGERH